MADENASEVAVMWSLTGLSVIIMMARLIMRWNRFRKFDLGDYFTIAAVFAVLARSSVENVALVWGDNQVHGKHRKGHHFTPQEIYQRETGAKLTMVNRILYTVYIWLQKAVVMCVVQILLQGIDRYRLLRVYWAILAVTFVASITVCFVECIPFRLYWQVVPDPGKCASGKIQLLVFSILEMLTDLMLIVVPLRHLVRIRRPWAARLRLVVLFMVGTTIIAVTLTRLLMNQLKYHRSGASHNIANVEILFAAFVANAPSIYGILNMTYGSSSQQSRMKSNPLSGDEMGGQLQTFGASSRASNRQRKRLSDWSPRSVGGRDMEIHSDEEFIIEPTMQAAKSPTQTRKEIL